jgi:hypothetical protein
MNYVQLRAKCATIVHTFSQDQQYYNVVSAGEYLTTRYAV